MPTHIRRLAPSLPLLALFIGAVTIAFSPVFARLAQEEGMGAIVTGFWRLALALPVLAALGGLGSLRPDSRPSLGPNSGTQAGPSRRRLSRRALRSLVLAGVFFAGDLLCWHLAIRWTSIAKATVFPNLAPIVVTILAFALFRERITRLFLVALGMAMTGALALMLGKMDQSVAESAAAMPHRLELLGDLMGVATALFYGAYQLAVADARRAGGLSALQVMAGSTLVGAVVMLAASLISHLGGGAVLGEPVFWPVSLNALLILLALGILCHALGQGLIAFALAYLPSAFGSIGLLVQPVTAVLLGYLIFGERLVLWEVLGIGLILISVVVARFSGAGTGRRGSPTGGS